MKLLVTIIPILAVLPVVAADPQPFAPTPFQLESPRPTTPPIATTGVQTWAGGDRVPIFDRLYLGGANNLRGFKFRDVGPKDENGEPIGGNSLWRLTAEYTFPIVSSDVGFGVRLDLPIGPVRMEYGIPAQRDADNSSSGKFQFDGDFPGPGYREQRSRFLNK